MQSVYVPHQVTLFKKNYDHVISDMYFKFYHTVAHNNPNYFITYGNGKSAARVVSGLRSNGAHRFYNYFTQPKYVVYFFMLRVWHLCVIHTPGRCSLRRPPSCTTPTPASAT